MSIRDQTAHVLKELRSVRGLTLRQVAQVTGFAHNTIWNWENNKREISMDDLNTLLKAYGYELQLELINSKVLEIKLV